MTCHWTALFRWQNAFAFASIALHCIAIYTHFLSDTLSISILFSQYHPLWENYLSVNFARPPSVGPQRWGLAVFDLLISCRGGWEKLLRLGLGGLTIKGEGGWGFFIFCQKRFLFFLPPLGGAHMAQKLIKCRAHRSRFLTIFIPPSRLPISRFKGFSVF
jgi:hypothetical protein